MAIAGVVTPLFTGTLSPSATALTAGLSRVLFPVVLLLSLTGLLVGILQSYDEFSIPALAPALWNVVIVVLMVILHAHFHGPNAVYSYAIAWLVATVVQFLLIAWALRRIDFRLAFAFDWRDPRVRQVLILFLPVTLSIGIINLDIFINAGLGALVSRARPDRDQRRLPDLHAAPGDLQRRRRHRAVPDPQPDGERRATPWACGARWATASARSTCCSIPSAALIAVLAVPITRLVYQHGTFHTFSTDLVVQGAVLVCLQPALRGHQPAAGPDVLRPSAALDPDQARRPSTSWWTSSSRVALYKPLGIAGPVIGTVVANVVMTGLQLRRLRIGFNGRLEGAQTTMITVRILVATAIATPLGYFVWKGLDSVLGLSLVAQIISVGVALAAAGVVYGWLVLRMRVPEARQIEQLVVSRLPGR